MAGERWVRLALPGVLALVALAFLYAAASLPVPPFGGPITARAFPTILGGALLFAAVLLLVERRDGSPAPQAAPTDDTRSSTWIPAAMATWTLAYVGALEPAGFIVATSVFLGGLMLAFHRGRPMQAIAVAVGFTMAIHQLFSRALGVPLPAGLLS